MKTHELHTNTFNLVIGIFILSLLIGCVARVPAHRPYDKVPIRSDFEKKQISVHGNGGWQDSTVELKVGDKIFIDAKGSWSGGLGWESGPSGKTHPITWRPFPEEPAATALIGRIGNDRPFTIGDQHLGTVTIPGNLFMRMNDLTTGDNSGALSVDVYVQQSNSVKTKADSDYLPVKHGQVIVQSTGNNWAVIIGISQYQHSGKGGLNNLIFADDDAKAFARSLRNLGWSESHIKLLTNEEATQRDISIALKSWLTKAGPNDQVILFWAGHGYPDPEDPEKVYLATYDTDISIPVTGYRMDEVRRALEEIGSKNVILFADTCHAGKLITRGDRGISIVPQIDKMQREQQIPKGWIFMVGADTDRQAIEHTSWTNGAFTHSLIKGLNGEADGFQSAGAKDGIVTMGELKDYIKTSMPDETQRVLGVAKHPVITTNTGDPDIWNLTLQVTQ